MGPFKFYVTAGYKAKIISTIVDDKGGFVLFDGYKAKIISTIVDRLRCAATWLWL